MKILTEDILIESKTARETELTQIKSEQATEILNKIKSLYFSLWEGEGIATTEEMGQFYEVEVATIRKVYHRHKDELAQDGVKTIRGKSLKDVRDILSLSSRQSNIMLWTPRGALRLGMLLRDSAVAKAVRTSLLNAVEKVIPSQAQEIEKLKLELEVAKAQKAAAEAQQQTAIAQERLLAASGALATINPGLAALALGKPNAVVSKTEIVEKTVLVNERGRREGSYKGISKTKLAQRYGMKKADEKREVAQVYWERECSKAWVDHC